MLQFSIHPSPRRHHIISFLGWRISMMFSLLFVLHYVYLRCRSESCWLGNFFFSVTQDRNKEKADVCRIWMSHMSDVVNSETYVVRSSAVVWCNLRKRSEIQTKREYSLYSANDIKKIQSGTSLRFVLFFRLALPRSRVKRNEKISLNLFLVQMKKKKEKSTAEKERKKERDRQGQESTNRDTEPNSRERREREKEKSSLEKNDHFADQLSTSLRQIIWSTRLSWSSLVCWQVLLIFHHMDTIHTYTHRHQRERERQIYFYNVKENKEKHRTLEASSCSFSRDTNTHTAEEERRA